MKCSMNGILTWILILVIIQHGNKWMERIGRNNKQNTRKLSNIIILLNIIILSNLERLLLFSISQQHLADCDRLLRGNCAKNKYTDKDFQYFTKHWRLFHRFGYLVHLPEKDNRLGCAMLIALNILPFSSLMHWVEKNENNKVSLIC